MKPIQIAGIRIPDSALARNITDFIRDTESEMLFRHSSRVYFWACLSGRREGLAFDPELLYAASMFHDIGITERYHDSPLRFEVDGANAARDFLRGHRIAEPDVEKVWLAIALHTTPGIPQHLQPEVALVQTGAGVDMAGRNHALFTEQERAAVVAAYPRGAQFATEVIDTFYAGLRQRPETTFGTFNDDFLACRDPNFIRGNLCCSILHSPWEQHVTAPAGHAHGT
jgi:HD domain